jgi:hypothetical protein
MSINRLYLFLHTVTIKWVNPFFSFRYPGAVMQSFVSGFKIVTFRDLAKQRRSIFWTQCVMIKS